MNMSIRIDPLTPVKINNEGKVVPLEEGDIIGIGVTIQEQASESAFLVLPKSFRDMMMERRRAALTEANAIGRLFGLPDVCPCCGKRPEK